MVEEREAGSAFFIVVEIALYATRHENVSWLVIRNRERLQGETSDRIPVVKIIVREYPAIVMFRWDLFDIFQIVRRVCDFISVGAEI